jgi:transcriptional regulator of acetoin/glycerol metabolism
MAKGYRFTELVYLSEKMPDELKAMLFNALRERGTVREAAAYLDIDAGSYYRYVRKHGWLEELRQVRDEVREAAKKPQRREDESEFGQLARQDAALAKDLFMVAYSDTGKVSAAAQRLGISSKRWYSYARQWNLFPEVQKASKDFQERYRRGERRLAGLDALR